jgi:signal transduction protein with GAF and PtsI domain
MAMTKPKPAADKAAAKQMSNFIKKGTVAKAAVEKTISDVQDEKPQKQINLTLLREESIAINRLRDLRPKGRTFLSRPAISLHDWILEAVHEKLARDNKANGIE